MSSPPIVGVPCLTKWPAGPSSRIGCPYSRRRRKRMKRGPAAIEITIATMPAIRTSTITRVTARERLGDALEAEHAARP